MRSVSPPQASVNCAVLRRGADPPSNHALGEALMLSERTVRAIRLDVLGLNRHELKHWRPSVSKEGAARRTERELICTTPFVGVWLLVPQLIKSRLVKAADPLKVRGRTWVRGLHIVLTLVTWAARGFQRLYHLDDFRHWADMGLALFTGTLHLWSDSTLWRWVHGLTPASATTFYQETVAPAAGQADS